MGDIYANVGVGNPEGGDLAPVTAVVDTGRGCAWMPASLLTRLKVEVTRCYRCTLEDASEAEYGFGMARFSIDNR